MFSIFGHQEMWIQTTIRYQWTPIGIPKIKETKHDKYGEEVEKLELSDLADGKLRRHIHFGKWLGSFSYCINMNSWIFGHWIILSRTATWTDLVFKRIVALRLTDSVYRDHLHIYLFLLVKNYLSCFNAIQGQWLPCCEQLDNIKYSIIDCDSKWSFWCIEQCCFCSISSLKRGPRIGTTELMLLKTYMFFAARWHSEYLRIAAINNKVYIIVCFSQIRKEKLWLCKLLNVGRERYSSVWTCILEPLFSLRVLPPSTHAFPPSELYLEKL